MKALRSTGILLFLASLLGLYVFFNERGPAQLEGHVVLLRAPRESIKIVKFSPSNLQLRREGEVWRIENPKTGVSALADDQAVKTLLDELQLVQSDSSVESATKLAQFGLQPVGARVDVDGQILILGNAPRFAPGQIYAQGNGHIALVEASLKKSAQKSLMQWRDQAVLRFQSDKIERFSIRAPQVNASFRREGESWNLEKPVKARADFSVVGGFLGSFSASRATKWLDESGRNPKKWGLETPRATILLDGAKLDVGNAVSGGYAARNSASRAVFVLPEMAFSLFNRPLRDWRESRVVPADLSAAMRLELTARGQTRVLVKSGEKWMGNGKISPKSQNAALDILAFASELTARDFVDSAKNLSQYGLDKPFLNLKIGADPQFELSFGRAKGQLYAQIMPSDSPGTVFVLNKEALNDIQDAQNELLTGSP